MEVNCRQYMDLRSDLWADILVVMLLFVLLLNMRNNSCLTGQYKQIQAVEPYGVQGFI
jgi:hypothetical protein